MAPCSTKSDSQSGRQSAPKLDEIGFVFNLFSDRRHHLISDALLIGDDLEKMRRLSVRIAIFSLRVGALEETVKSLLHEREADFQNG